MTALVRQTVAEFVCSATVIIINSSSGDGGDDDANSGASGSALGARYPRCKVIVAPCTSAFASCDLIVTDCLSPRVTKFKLAVNVGPLATT